MEYDNLAYDIYYQPEETTHKNKKMSNHKNLRAKRVYLRRIYTIVAVAFAASFMISQFVAVKETQQQTASLSHTLAQEEAVTSQKMYDLERSVDLAEIEEEATTRLGMQRPEKYQIVYVNVKNDDATEKTAGEVEGFWNRTAAVAKDIFSNIVAFFSIE